MSVDLRTHVPHPARIYNFVLGGKDNFEPDRIAATEMMQAQPMLAPWMRANRRFMTRAAAYLAQQGFSQFLDIGTGLPTRPNMHEIVQAIHPAANIVYVDNDPIVLVHARALLTPAAGSTGKLAYLDADLHDPEKIFTDPAITGGFDLDKPVAVIMLAILQLVEDGTAHQVVDDIMSRLAPGSALAISAVCGDEDPEGIRQILHAANSRGVPVRARTKAGIAALFGDLRLADPGVVGVHRWLPDDEETTDAAEPAGMYGGIAYKQ